MITLNNKNASAVDGVPSRGASSLREGAMTVREILDRKKATQRRGSVWDGILLPSARASWMMPALEWVTPDYVERVLRATLTGESPEEEHALYDLMMQTWPRLVKNIMELKDAVCDLVWNVQNPEGVELLNHLAERTRDGMRGDVKVDGQGWRGTIHGLMDGWFAGVAVREIDWQVRGCRLMPQSWLPRQTRRVHPRWYGWSTDTGIFGLRTHGSDNLGDFPDHKFLIAINNVSFGHPSGGALLRSLAWFWCAANFSKDWLLNFAQLFGQPLRWATYDTSDPSIKDHLEAMLENMGSAAWAAAPQGTNLELKEASNKGADNPQNQMIQMADTACDLLILGQTLTSSPGQSGSRALGEVHYNVRSDIINAAAGWIAEILNEQLLPSVFALNSSTSGDDAVNPFYDPSSKIVDDPTAKVDRILKILNGGIPLAKSYVYESIEAPTPGAEDELFEAKGDDKIYPKALALSSLASGGLPISEEFAYQFMGVPRPSTDETLLTPPEKTGMGPMMAKALEKMPAQARDYYLARLNNNE